MIIGIDLGTTFSCVAYIDQDGKPTIIPNREGERMTPSVLLFDGDNTVVGTTAKNDAFMEPLNTVQFIKRQMGNPSYKFMREDQVEFTPEEISAIILKRLKEDTESFLGEKVDGVVITVPAYFNDSQRKATQDAGKIAGLNVLKIVNEPTAAALAYGLSNNMENKSLNFMVYDLGGGTFDVTIMNIINGDYISKASSGDKNLGGFDFDNCIISYVCDEFKRQFKIDIEDDDSLMQELRSKAETCKKILSSKNKTTISIACKGEKLKLEITKGQFEDMIRNYIDRTVMYMESVLDDASMMWSDIDKILLVGGSTRISLIPEVIEKVSGIKPSNEINPDEAVAIGAALQAKYLVENNTIPEDKIKKIVDVNSHSLGVLCIDDNNREINSIILKRNTPLPAKKYKEYYTMHDNQEEISLEVTEGEDEDPNYITIIGETLIKMAKRPKGSPIRVVVSYDEDSVIHVYAQDLVDNSHLGEMKIKRIANLDDDEINEKTSKIKYLKID